MIVSRYRMSAIAAIFDLDKTLLLDSSEQMIVRYLRQTGRAAQYIRLIPLLKVLLPMLLFRVGVLRADAAMRRLATMAVGISVDEFWLVINEWFREMAVHAISTDGAQKVAWHRSQGHIPVICSGGSQFSVQPVAAHLKIEHAIFTDWLVQDGRLLGQLRLPIAYAEGKVYWMERWAAQQGVDLTQSFFYTDSVSDRPLLEHVGHPIAVNPDKKLARLARLRRWEIQRWDV